MTLAIEHAWNEIQGTVVGPLNHPADLMGWCYLWEGNAPDGSFAGLSREELDRTAREFARTWLEGAFT
jgi:hypothetical protein